MHIFIFRVHNILPLNIKEFNNLNKSVVLFSAVSFDKCPLHYYIQQFHIARKTLSQMLDRGPLHFQENVQMKMNSVPSFLINSLGVCSS